MWYGSEFVTPEGKRNLPVPVKVHSLLPRRGPGRAPGHPGSLWVVETKTGLTPCIRPPARLPLEPTARRGASGPLLPSPTGGPRPRPRRGTGEPRRPMGREGRPPLTQPTGVPGPTSDVVRDRPSYFYHLRDQRVKEGPRGWDPFGVWASTGEITRVFTFRPLVEPRTGTPTDLAGTTLSLTLTRPEDRTSVRRGSD